MAELEGPELGRVLSATEVARYATTVYPDGRGLPAGSGSVAGGRVVYDARCVACHGLNGRGGSGGELAGGDPDLTRDSPDQNVGTYWPYATTLFDFIRRAMPMDAPGSLSDDEVYAVVAFVLHLNGLLAADEELDSARLAALVMPNRGGFDGIEAIWPPAAGAR